MSQQSVVKSDGEIVVRSADVPTGLPYERYRPHLRRDFVFTCAYCTMSEAEAQAIRFTIDHYEPQKARPDLTNRYENLMYCCDECNTRKGDRSPPPAARVAGYRFFKADQDKRSDHFESKGDEIYHKTNVGFYTVQAVDLNRESLRRIRGLRARLTNCQALVAGGILALRNFRYDQLPPGIRGQAMKAISDATKAEDQLATNIDVLLSSYAKSPLLEDEPTAEELVRIAARNSELDQLRALYPGVWRGRDNPVAR